MEEEVANQEDLENKMEVQEELPNPLDEKEEGTNRAAAAQPGVTAVTAEGATSVTAAVIRAALSASV